MKRMPVEKHIFVCRNYECLSQVGCGKDFWGVGCKGPVKCISEGQKYGGKDCEAETRKGDAKQQCGFRKLTG